MFDDIKKDVDIDKFIHSRLNGVDFYHCDNENIICTNHTLTYSILNNEIQKEGISIKIKYV